MATIKKDTLHPENEPEVDIYPKTSIDQVENLQANLDALNGDIANANGEIVNIVNKVGDINKDVSTLKYNDTNQDRRIQVLENISGTTINRVEIAENNITVLNTAYGSYTDYTEVTNGFLLTYLSGKQIELPIKAGTNVTFSKYPGTNQIVINATGGSVPDNIAILSADNDFTGNNQFVNIRSLGILEFYGGDKQYRFSKTISGFKFFIISGNNSNSLLFPNRTGTLALVEDIPNTSSFPTLAGSNNWTGQNVFDNGITMGTTEYTPEGPHVYYGDYRADYGERRISTQYQDKSGVLNLPQGKSGTLALIEDLPKLADYPTTIFFNNYNAGIGYKVTSTGTTKTVVSTDNNGAQIVIGDSNTGLTLATNARPKVLEDSTVKEVAYVSDIPNTSSFPTLEGTNIWTGSNIFDASITTKGNLFVGNGITSYTISAITREGYIYTFPDDTGTFALTKNIPTRPQYLQGFGIGTPTYFSFKIGIYHTLTITLIDSYKSTSIIIPNDYDGSQIDLDIDGDYFEVTLENEKLSVKNTTSVRSWLGKLE